MKKPSGKAVWGAALGLMLLAPATSIAESHHSPKLDHALQQPSSGERDVIVRVKPGRKAAVKSRITRNTSRVKEHRLIDAVSVRLSSSEIARLADDPDVEGISLDAAVSASGSTNTSDVVSDVKQSLALGNWFNGASVTVAIIDSGVAALADFDTRIVGQFDFSGGKLAVPMTPDDPYGHGTHIAGLIGSNGSSSANKYGGVAPGVRLLSLRVLDKKGSGKTSDVIAALEFAVANRAWYGIKVINLSLGHPIYESAKTDPLVQAVEAAVRAGIVVVVASGNYGVNPLTGTTGFGGIASPGNSPSAITVGAAMTNHTPTRTDDRLAPYSSRGPSWYDGIAKPDVLAPGQAMVSNDSVGSTLETTYPSLVLQSGSTKYLKLSGSSMATGVVSGLVAVMIEANQYGSQQRWDNYQSTLKGKLRSPFPATAFLKSAAIKAILQYTATRIHDENGVVYGPLEQGTGLVNGFGAIALAYFIDSTQAPGSYWMTSQYSPSTIFGSTEEPWSQTVIWGTRQLRGASVVDVNQSAWADNIVWGTGELNDTILGTMSEDNIVWGTLVDEDNIVWGTSVPLSTDLSWAGNALLEDNIVWGTALTWDDNLVWGDGLIGYFDGTGVIWGECSGDEDNIVWGTLTEDNIVWGTAANKVTVLGATTGGGL